MAANKPSGPPASTLPPPQFFVDHKKGEVNELKQLLRSVYIDKDPSKKKDVIKKVIAYMTLGIDVSKLYPEMVKASRTDDVVTKKMVYLYLINYAQQNQELAILAINTFLMDLKQTNHKIRGLALRSLCSLKFDGVTEYMQNALQESLNDVDPYVKKTAIIGCVKFFHLSKSNFKKTDFLTSLYSLTKDNDPLVVINAVEAINEIQADKGGIEIDRGLIIPLLNRIKDFNEWGQSIILDICSKYNPQDQQEKFDIMNLLEERFKHASSSVVLGTVKVFLHLTKDDPNLYKQVIQRLQAPLITLMTSSETTESYEISFNVLSHIHLIVMRGGNVYFENEYKQFFIKYYEPTYIKNIKLQILGQIASENNIQEIVNELCEYVTDVNAEIAKRSIRCFGNIIVRLSPVAQNVTQQLRNFMSLKINYVTNETLIVLQDILRKYPSFVDEFLPFLNRQTLDQINSEDGKLAFVFLLGHFGHKIEEAPYILEKIIEEERESNHTHLKIYMVTACTKLFFRRAPEMQSILSGYFQYVMKHSQDMDLRQRVTFYYRLLRQDLNMARKVIDQQSEKDDNFLDFFEDRQSEKRERLFMEFNSLSVVYGKPSEKFLKDQVLKNSMASEKKYYPKERGFKTADQEKILASEEQPNPTEDLLEMGGPSNAPPQGGDLLDTGADLLGGSTTNTTSATASTADNTLLSTDLLGGGGSNDLLGGAPANNSNPMAAPSGGAQYSLDGMMGGSAPMMGSSDLLGGSMFNQQVPIQLGAQSELDSERFQQLWMQLPVGCGGQPLQHSIKPEIQMTTQMLEGHFKSQNLHCMASGQLGTELKFFFHCQMADKSGFFMLEMVVNLQAKQMSTTVKSTRPEMDQSFQGFFGNLVKDFTV